MATEKRVKLDNYAVPQAPRLGLRGWLRWMWRQVTSMRVALILLLLLALASIPGSLLPQRPQDPAAVRGFLEANGAWGDILDALGLLDVFGSAWFTAIYVLLFASLVGCILPRAAKHYRALRAPIAAAPRSFARYEGHAKVAVDDAHEAVARAQRELRPQARWWGAVRGYRVRVDERTAAQGRELALAADAGHVREIGNLVFHAALVGILSCMLVGALVQFRGQAIIVEGRSFTNAVVAYDSFESGRLFDERRLNPFTLTLNELTSVFEPDGRPVSFTADITLLEPGLSPRTEPVQVNRPLQVDGAKVYLQGNGYAPDFTITDADGNVAHAGPTPFLPQDAVYTSQGVIKVPDVTSGPQLGFKATLLPSAVIEGDTAISVHPTPTNPVIVLTMFTGDLGLDDGVPQNVYVLDESRLSPVRDADGDVAVLLVTPGQTVELPNGLGTLTWDALPRFVALDLRADPTLPWLLAFAIVSLGGLSLSLFGARRRLWMIVPLDAPVTVVTAAGLAPAHDTALSADIERALAAAAGKEEA